MNGQVLVTERLGPEWRRWAPANAIELRLLHPGNHVSLGERMDLKRRCEREAGDFAHALLVDAEEGLTEGCTHSWGVAEHFGVPDEMVGVQARLLPADAV